MCRDEDEEIDGWDLGIARLGLGRGRGGGELGCEGGFEAREVVAGFDELVEEVVVVG